jgi:hypothetical protein
MLIISTKNVVLKEKSSLAFALNQSLADLEQVQSSSSGRVAPGNGYDFSFSDA